MGFDLYTFFFLNPWPWWLGGICIGLIVPLLYYFLNTALGVSTGYGNFLKIMLPGCRLKWLNSADYANVFNWRFYFLVGIILGGFLAARGAGMPWTTTEMGRFTFLLDWSFPALAVWFLGGGLLLGLGGRIAHGCTSGHSIHGLANLHLSSLIATIFFLIGGIITVRLLSRFLWGGM
jgi:uncharacterized membrane protein YedE/YeeE